ncbi:2-oxoglutarate dehydrogenase E1 component [Synoicihabitans lomoniglobus]|uniref:oxoglutarate dehydrogenase (succinyl-transferring) n=1 Tax=Synoicihabitans lomoniglobus TaxID=2909285 RepID=A0AAF0CPZ3_9BACT|nr:2-oxoglutarate dehydrogenase E1 component [Opitutaceae bacterium LMO-M01]WED65899.1 2-oxoglutarate dehydrogenase E1 component [Opitutaceae bacterium LMO-M01]
MNPSSLSAGANAEVFESLYEQWLEDPSSVDATWRAFFQGFTLGHDGGPMTSAGASAAGVNVVDSRKQVMAIRMINAHRSHGHMQAHLDPLNPRPAPHPKLSPESFEFTEADMDESFTLTRYKGGGQMKLRDIIDTLNQTYSGTIGVEYMHVGDMEARDWLQLKMEMCNNQPSFDKFRKTQILRRVHKAELFEKFLHTKFVGQKRFALEGGETTIAALDSFLEKCPELGIEEVVMGMAHRGRLSVLANILRKPFSVLFDQFSENYIPDAVAGDGDVKYHLGFEAVFPTKTGGDVEVRLAANPSHLEIVNPVVEGKARARQRIRGDLERRKVCPLLIHGDAAFAGQGVVAETLNFSQLPGYRTGGTVHFVINNQIGFTTNPADARSTHYCTDVAKMIEAPVFHVNGDDPEAVCYVTQLALEFRVKFQRDVVIDMVCYRRHGHNESDEPAFTQPLMYKSIRSHPLVSSIYTDQLIKEGTITQADADAIVAEYTGAMEADFKKAKEADAARVAAKETQDQFRGSTAIFQPSYSHAPVLTGVTQDALAVVSHALTHTPDGFHVNKKIQRLLDNRAKAFTAGGPIEWSYAESLAWGTLLGEGTPVRLSGQDCRRGTFSQRHAYLYDEETRERYAPLDHVAEKQGKLCVYNSLLSEAAVLGFDYGYSLDYPEMLCQWEAQFGDFVNGAQVVIDQFITTSESKWQRVSGIVLLLPHGYEGQGPEHSSARLERFLQACAEDNIQVANISTPANFFHALRRQMHRDFRKPLVVMSPKSLLRHPEAVSNVEDFLEGTSFLEIMPDPTPSAAAKRLILCSGKVYYDLDAYRREKEITDTTIVRIEQLYPLHTEELKNLAASHADARLVWCQEESHNMGAWSYLAPQLETIFGRKAIYAGRDAAASPAVGALALHKRELAQFLMEAFSL